MRISNAKVSLNGRFVDGGVEFGEKIIAAGPSVTGGEDLSGGKATLSGTDTLAGSSISLMEGLRRAVRFGIPLEAAVTAATLAPAGVIRMEDTIGSLDCCKWADMTVLDQNLIIKTVYIEGRIVV